MKRLVLGLLCWLLLQTSGALAGSGFFGVRLEMPVVPAPGGNSPPFGGAHVGWDFSDASSGFGLRFSASTFFVVANRVALDGFGRFRLNSAGANLYAGAGLAALLTTVGFNALDAHGLIGIELPLGWLGLFFEFAPGVSFVGGGVAPMQPPQYISWVGLVWLDFAAGLNWRF